MGEIGRASSDSVTSREGGGASATENGSALGESGSARSREPDVPTTVNRLLLQGARRHDRDCAFMAWAGDDVYTPVIRAGDRPFEEDESDTPEQSGETAGPAPSVAEAAADDPGWVCHPDWRADRHSIRIALLLRKRLEVPRGARVALSFPLTPEWFFIERAAWAVSIVTVPVWPDWDHDRVGRVLRHAEPTVLFARHLEEVRALRAAAGWPESVRATVLMQGEKDDTGETLGYADFMYYGGILDTPERAAMCRTGARETSADRLATLEWGARRPPDDPVALTHGQLGRRLQRARERLRPAGGGTAVFTDRSPELSTRVLVHAAWSDGSTRSVLAPSDPSRMRAAELDPRLVAGSPRALAALARRVPEDGGEGARGGGDGAGSKRWVVVTGEERKRTARENLEAVPFRSVTAEELGISVEGTGDGGSAGERTLEEQGEGPDRRSA